MRVGIAGAGLIGRLLAWRLGAAGHAVTVFDPGNAERSEEAAAWVAAGLLSPWAELECGGNGVLLLGLRALQIWPRWLAELELSGAAGFDGSLLLAQSGDRACAERLFARFRAAGQPLPEALAQPRTVEAALAPGLLAWSLPGEGWLDPPALLQALQAQAAGVRWQWGHRVQQLAPGQIDGQVFDWVIDARGLGARDALPLRGVRGEIYELHAPGLLLRRPLRLLHPRLRVYLLPRSGERLIVGASEIDSEDRGPVSLRSTVELLGAAQALLPALAEARLLAARSGLRPALPDNQPLLHSEAGLMRINGLYRHGWLIAPALVEMALEGLA